MKTFNSLVALAVIITGTAWMGLQENTPDGTTSAVFESGDRGMLTQNGEWVNLIKGGDLSNWVRRGGNARYRLENGQIVGSTVPDTPNSFLCTKMDYRDFILELEVKVDPRLNSGIQIRSQSTAWYRNGRVHGYQVEIDPSDRAWSGGIYDEARRGWLYDLEDRPEARKAFKNGRWNKYRIKAVGDTLQTWINGIPVAHLVDSVDASGFIALQVHSTDHSEPLQVRWRNIRVKVLN